MHRLGQPNTSLASALENGLVLEAWNILRALVETVENSSGEIEGVKLSVWFNPMFPETG